MKEENAIEIIKSTIGGRLCEDAAEWLGEKTLEEAWSECDRGDWMLWYAERILAPYNKELFLAKGRVANLVRHLMEERSKKTVDTAIAYGQGEVEKSELVTAAAASAAYSVYTAAAAAAAYAATAFTAYATAYAAAVAATKATAYDASAQNVLSKAADICREIWPSAPQDC